VAPAAADRAGGALGRAGRAAAQCCCLATCDRAASAGPFDVNGATLAPPEAGSGTVAWSTYVALGDSLTAGRGDEGRDGRPVGWAQRLADILSVRTAVRCALTNLAADGASVRDVLGKQLPAVAARKPDLVSVTVGVNDIRVRGFDELSFKADLRQLFEGLATTQATLLTCTLPDLTAVMSLSPELREVVRERIRQASDIIREQAESYSAVCLDAWSMPGLTDPDLYSPDGIHPNPRGHQLLAAACADILAPRSAASRAFADPS
jgi:lysophospholipase L1-like esterase